MTVYFDKNYSGKQYVGSGIEWTYRPDIDKFAGVSISVDNNTVGSRVTLTGYWTVRPNRSIYYETSAGSWVNLYGDSWQPSGSETYSQSQAQSYVDKMIENNKQIISCNLFCARYASKLTAQEKQLLYQLQSRLETRNQRLISDGLVTNITTSTPAGYSQLQSYMQRFMQTGGVGVVLSGTAVIVITAIVIASLSTAAYFAYKYLYKESAEDVKYSKQLTETLMARLTPEEFDQLMRETKGIVTKAKIKQLIAGSGSLLKWAILGTAAYVVYNNLKGGRP